MGYRLDIGGFNDLDDIKPLYYGTKYYGYKDLENSISYLYLCSIGKFKGDEYFDYCSKNLIFLNNNEMKIFLYLYNIDINNYSDYKKYDDEFINDDSIQNILNNIEDYYLYALCWG